MSLFYNQLNLTCNYGRQFRGPGGQSIKFYRQSLAKITEGLVGNQ